MPRPIRARLDLDALRHNLAVARHYAGPAKVLAVAKAAAYGHGLARVLPALESADGIAVLDIDDAVALRDRGYEGRIVLLEGCFDEADLREARDRSLHSVVHDVSQLDRLERSPSLRPSGVLLKMNTGMNRLGFAPGAFPAALERVARLTGVTDITLMTHFASADEGRDVREQLDRFLSACGGAPYATTLANSAALIRDPEAHGDWVRPGIMLYGATPFADQSAQALGLRPVMTLASRLIGVQHVRRGEAVGYGGVFVADRDMRVGVVACGYADGYPRHAPTGTPVRVGDVRTRTLGRVSMDMITVDLTPCPDARVGSPVTLWGEGLPVDDVATAAGTVGYELLCALALRVPVSVAPGRDSGPES
ncbi:MAG: alanine racemase [Burkholderiales bacterium]